MSASRVGVTRYFVDEAAFDLPDLGFVDLTTHRLERRSSPLVLRAQRGEIPPGKGLEDIVDQRVRDADIEVRGHRVTARRALEIAGCPAIEIVSEWRGDAQINHTRQAYLAIGDRWVVLSVSGARDEREACDAILDRAIETFRVRS